MAQPPLKQNDTPPGIKDRIAGALRARRWAALEEPPTSPENAGAYLAALEKTGDEGRTALERALLHCDLKSRTFRPSCRDAYLSAAMAYPDDERCQFYIAALAYHELIEVDPGQRERYLVRLLKPDWRRSALWTRLQLSRDAALAALSRQKGGDVQLLEAAFRAAPERSEERRRIGQRLAELYRAEGRCDDEALALARYLFVNEPDDIENTAFLADWKVKEGSADGDTILILERALQQAQSRGDSASEERWSGRLAAVYLATGRVDNGAFAVLRTASRLRPEDQLLEAATAYAAALNESSWGEADVLRLLERILPRRDELIPLFVERRWRWELVVRALALAWGASGRDDQVAHTLYAYAVELSPEDRDLWGYYANSLAARRDTSPTALHAYERARSAQRAGDLILSMLGYAYLRRDLHQTNERPKVIATWQDLYIRGLAGPEILTALSDTLAENGEVSDTAIQLWENLAQQNPSDGQVRLHLAVALRSRGANSEAIAWFREAVRLLPEDFEALVECGRLVLEGTADASEAVGLLTRAVKLPEGRRHLEAHVLLGEALAAADRREEAKEVFHKVVEELDPGHTRSLLMLARLNLRYEQDSVAAAESLYARALEQEPDNPETYRRLAELYRDEGESRLEQAALEKYLSLSSADADQFAQLADMYIRRKDWERAEQALRQIVSLGKADKKTYSLLGEVLNARNRAA
jgi:tetratricopeptide (TPR) repeat protein